MLYMFYLGVLTEIWKHLCQFWNQHPWIYQYAKSRAKPKFSNLRPKNALFGYFWVVILKNYQYMRNLHSRIAKFCAKIKILKIWHQKCLIWELNFYHNWKQHLRICENAKFHAKAETLKFGTMTYLGIF